MIWFTLSSHLTLHFNIICANLQVGTAVHLLLHSHITDVRITESLSILNVNGKTDICFVKTQQLPPKRAFSQTIRMRNEGEKTRNKRQRTTSRVITYFLLLFGSIYIILIREKYTYTTSTHLNRVYSCSIPKCLVSTVCTSTKKQPFKFLQFCYSFFELKSSH